MMMSLILSHITALTSRCDSVAPAESMYQWSKISFLKGRKK